MLIVKITTTHLFGGEVNRVSAEQDGKVVLKPMCLPGRMNPIDFLAGMVALAAGMGIDHKVVSEDEHDSDAPAINWEYLEVLHGRPPGSGEEPR